MPFFLFLSPFRARSQKAHKEQAAQERNKKGFEPFLSLYFFDFDHSRVREKKKEKGF